MSSNIELSLIKLFDMKKILDQIRFGLRNWHILYNIKVDNLKIYELQSGGLHSRQLCEWILFENIHVFFKTDFLILPIASLDKTQKGGCGMYADFTFKNALFFACP